MLYHPQKPEEITARLLQAFALPETQRAAMGTAARAAMLPLTWEAHLAGWLEAMEQLAAK
jgi:hypothetical protein